MRRTFYTLSLLGIAAILISKLTACQPYIALKEEIAKGPYGANWGNTSKYDRAIMKNPNDAAAYYRRGSQYRILGDKQKALADYHKAAEICKQQKDNFCYESTLDDIERLQQSSPSTP